MKKLINLVGSGLVSIVLVGCQSPKYVENLNETPVREYAEPRARNYSVQNLNGTSVKDAKEGYFIPIGKQVKDLNGTPTRE